MTAAAALQQWLVDHLPARVPYVLAERRYRRQEPELARIAELAAPGRAAVDVGAWLGPWTRALARRASVVHAFEPQADLAQRLARVVPANVVVHHAAVGERSGTAALAVGHDPGSAALAHLVPPDRAGELGAAVAQVPLVALDDLDLADVAFVKVDVEGHELAVLRGAERLLLRDRPVLLVEIEQRHLEWPMATIFEWLEERGWAGSFLRDGHWVELAGFDVEHDQTQWTAQLPHPAYVNNFRFDPV